MLSPYDPISFPDCFLNVRDSIFLFFKSVYLLYIHFIYILCIFIMRSVLDTTRQVNHTHTVVYKTSWP